jgi:hypothetical protein
MNFGEFKSGGLQETRADLGNRKPSKHLQEARGKRRAALVSLLIVHYREHNREKQKLLRNLPRKVR